MNRLSILIMLAIISASLLCAKDEAQRLYEVGEYEEAVRKYERIIMEHPEWEEAHFGRGAALYKSEQIDEAMREFEMAISTKDPAQKAAVFYNMGNGFFQSGRLEESLKFYKRALELNPDDYDAKHNFELARQMMQQQQQNQQNQPDQQNRDQKQQQQQSQQNQPEQQDQQKEEQQSQPQQQPQQQKQEREKSQEEAAQVLNALKDNEKKMMQERMKAKYSGMKKEKDW